MNNKIAKVEIVFKSGAKQVFTGDEFNWEMTGNELTSFSWVNPRPGIGYLRLNDISAIWVIN